MPGERLTPEVNTVEGSLGYFSATDGKWNISIDQKDVKLGKGLGADNYHTLGGILCKTDLGYRTRQEKVNSILKGIEDKSQERMEKIERNLSFNSHKTLDLGGTEQKLTQKGYDLHSSGRKEGLSKTELNLASTALGCD